jgi:hypothetical protein
VDRQVLLEVLAVPVLLHTAMSTASG